MLQGDTNPAPGASPSEPAAAGGVSGEHPQPHAEPDQCLAAQQQRGRVPTAAGSAAPSGDTLEWPLQPEPRVKGTAEDGVVIPNPGF